MSEQSFTGRAGRRRHHRGALIERITADLLEAMEHARSADRLAAAPGLLQGLDPRVKLIGLLLLIGSTVSSHRLWVVAVLWLLAVALAMASRVPLRRIMLRVGLSVLLFTGVLAIPAVFLVPGEPLYRLPWLDWPITVQGLTSAGFLVGRALTCASFAALLIVCTPWPQVLKALRVFRVPVVFIVILGMTYRYIFLFLRATQDLFEARRSRLLARLTGRDARRIAIANAGVLLSKSVDLSSEVYLAMLSRGYRGTDHTLHDFSMSVRDWAALAVFSAVAAAAFWVGR